MELSKIMGKQVVAIKGTRSDMRRKKGFHPIYVLFDDGQTYIEFEDQDYYAHHDCDTDAKIIRIRQDKRYWDCMMGDGAHFPDADIDLSWY